MATVSLLLLLLGLLSDGHTLDFLDVQCHHFVLLNIFYKIFMLQLKTELICTTSASFYHQNLSSSSFSVRGRLCSISSFLTVMFIDCSIIVGPLDTSATSWSYTPAPVTQDF